MKKIALIGLMIFSASLTSQAQTKWMIDKTHSNIGFSVMHYVITEVEGNFKEFEGTVISDSEDSFDGAEIEFVAKVASISTDNEKRDNHLKSDDFFNAEEFPEIKFSGKLEGTAGNYQLVGDFTMRDVTKQVKFDVKYNGMVDLEKGDKAGFKITGTVDRFDYGIKFDRALETGGLVVSQEVDITCNIELNEETGT
jgi:polyisoprenoid-binding protein YceI